MTKVVIADMDELQRRIGQEIAVSDWFTITQERIDRFADATDDHQWIHVDRARAARAAFGGTIAHGYLTLSLIPRFTDEVLQFPAGGMSINYGLNRVRFPAPVGAGKRVRARFVLAAVERVPGAVQTVWKITIELDGSDKPACVAETISRRYDA